MQFPMSSSAPSRVFVLLGIVLTVTALYFAKAVLLPAAVAVLLSFVLSPIADRLERLHLGRVPSTLMIVAVTTIIMFAMAWTLTDQAIQLGERMPDYKDNLLSKIHYLKERAGDKFHGTRQAFEEIGAEISGKQAKPTAQTTAPKSPESKSIELKNPDIQQPPAVRANEGTRDPVAVRVVEMPATPLTHFAVLTEPLLTPLAYIGGIVLLVTFILFKREDMRNRLIEILGRSDLHASTEALTEATRRMTRYLRAMLMINSICGLSIAIGLALIGVPNPILWGVLAMALRFVPYIGPWLSAAMPLALSLGVFSSWQQPLLVVALFILVEFIANTILEPWLYGSSTGVSPVGVILAAMFWTWIWGPVGLVVAMPLTVCAVVAANYVPSLRLIAILLGDGPNLSLQERIYQRLLANDEEEAGQLVAEFVKGAGIEQFHDELVLPLLAMMQNGIQHGRLSEERAALVLQCIRDLVEETDAQCMRVLDESSKSADAIRRPRGRILCVSTSDDASEAAAMMTELALRRLDFEVEIASSDLLANELVDRIEHDCCDIVVISAFPPLAIPGCRYLLKKLRGRCGTIPVLVGLWRGQDRAKARQRLLADGASEVVTSVAEIAAAVQRIAVRLDGQTWARQPVLAVTRQPAIEHCT